LFGSGPSGFALADASLTFLPILNSGRLPAFAHAELFVDHVLESRNGLAPLT
jgi:hypothetical protein